MGGRKLTHTPNQTQEKHTESAPGGYVVACGCGFGGKPQRGTLGEKCPLGFPWRCLRQLRLPFPEPTDRRKSATDAGGTPYL
jgi:hypothetical protein